MSAQSLLIQPSQLLQGEPIGSGENSQSDQCSAAFIYPNALPTNPDPAAVMAHPFPSQNHPPPPFPTHGAPTSFAFSSVPPHLQNLSFPNTNPAHPALHLTNLNHQVQPSSFSAPFPPSSFSHPSSLPHLQPSTFQQSVSSTPSLPAAVHPQNLPNPTTSSPSSYPPVELGGMPQFNHPAPYRPEVVLHHPSLLPQLDPSIPSRLPSSTPPTALYPSFPSYPLRLCQDPHPSLSIPFRHLYRHQHGRPQGSYLDMSTRAVF